jgi:hypothetical protein
MRALPILALALALASGCGRELLTRQQVLTAPWKTFAEAKGAYDQIVIGVTTIAELQALRLDPASSHVSTLVTYVDVRAFFVPHEGVTLEDADPAVQRCVQLRDRCTAWRIETGRLRQERIGNFLLDWLLIRRTTRTRGWDFSTLVLMADGVVLYKIWNGQPSIRVYRDRIWPLGFLTDLLDRLSPSVTANDNSEETS